MKIKILLSPMGNTRETLLHVSGSTVTVNGTDYDLSELPDGATAEHPILGHVSRDNDNYECTIVLGHGANAPEETRFPKPITLEAHDGPVELPLYDVPQEDPKEELPE